jgi:hypothetical protein
MGGGRRKTTRRAVATRTRTRPRRAAPPPIPLDPIELLAGLGPGVRLEADDLPAGIASVTERTAAETTVAEVGKLLRGEPTVRRMIRNVALRPRSAPPDDRTPEPPRHPRDKPGE